MNIVRSVASGIRPLATLSATLVACATLAAQFQHDLKGEVKPWTNEGFLDDPQEFHFAVIGDLTGGERKGFYAKAVTALNLLRPEFVMSVGDLVAGGGASRKDLEKQWASFSERTAKLEMPFFHVVGNHDIWTGFTGMSPARQTSIDVWKELHGTNTYYNFTYKGCHFVCLNSMDVHDYYPPRQPLSVQQLNWAAGEMEKNSSARWHFLFMHKPLDWMSDRWLAFERKIGKFNYTVFCGDWHNHCTAVRHGKKYHMVGTTGGGFDCGVLTDDLRYGVMDSVTWVTVTKKGPVVSNLALSGIHGDTIQTCATTKGWIEAPLDYPSHLSEDPIKYANEKNTALIPAEVMEGPGYDWHFKLAVMLRQGRVYASGMEKLKSGKQRVILLGDETASALAADYGKDWQVFDMGFAGDKVQNVLWRVIQGTLSGYAPDRIVISVGKHNAGVNTPDEIAAAKAKLVGLVRERAPKAEVVVRD